MGKLDFDFPTSAKDAVQLYQLQADVQDRVGGIDDVDETQHIDKEYAEGLWQRAQTPSVKALAEAAEGRNGLTEHTPLPKTSPALLATQDLAKPTSWSALADAFEAAEESGPLESASITGALAGLGFSRKPALEDEAGAMVFKRGDEIIGLRVYQLGAIRAVEVAVADTDGETDDDANAFGAFQAGTAGTYVAGTLVEGRHWKKVVDQAVKVLEKATSALAKVSGDEPDLPVLYEAFKDFIDSGKTEDKLVEDAREIQEIRAKQAQITQLWIDMVREGSAPNGLMLQFDGPDGAGKTSSSKYLAEAIMMANEELAADDHWSQSTEIFKAPTDADKAWMKEGAAGEHGLADWLARHVMRGVPGPNELMIKDRFQPGDFVYVPPHSDERLAEMAADNAEYERWVQGQGVLMFKAILWADQKKQAKTFGKRMGRGMFVDAIRNELAARGQLTEAAAKELDFIKNKVEGTDLNGLTTFSEVLPRYQAFAEATGEVVDCPVIESTDRHAARLELLDRFLGALQAHREARQSATS